MFTVFIVFIVTGLGGAVAACQGVSDAARRDASP